MARLSAAGRCLEVMTTTSSRRDARRIARILVAEQLAACVQIVGPVQSTYRWQGRIETTAEWLCLIKTTRRRYPQLEKRLRGLHPYTTPEIVALPFERGLADYLNWLEAAVCSEQHNPPT